MKIFVFGSNLAGRHGAGAALYAAQRYGAIYGVGRGRTGAAYALPTKREIPGTKILTPLTLDEINFYVKELISYARENPDLTFEITRVACGRAGYSEYDIAPFFLNAPPNCTLPRGWRTIAAANA